MGEADRKVIEAKIQAGEEKERRMRKKKRKEAYEKEKKHFWEDFKKFISKGNVLDLAVAVVIANAFNAIVNGLVKNIIMPYVTYFTSGVSINEWEHVLREEVTNPETGEILVTKISAQYGLWLQAIIDFIIIAFSIFLAVRILKNMQRTLRAKEHEEKEAAAAKKKAEEEAAAAKKKAEDDAKAAEEKARAEEEKAMQREFYENVRKQAKLLESIDESLKNK